ncbi:MAG: hypothetical protein F6K55_34340 [Moorea sp. SIO4A3]|nr:hypothetical protein [Moorena sp. SIO4A3]
MIEKAIQRCIAASLLPTPDSRLPTPDSRLPTPINPKGGIPHRIENC